MSNLVINANSIYDRVIRIGRQTENLVSEITFNVNMWIEEYGQGECVLNVKRNGDVNAYLVPMTIADGMTTWTITDTDTAKKGRGEIQLKYTTGEKVKTSPIFTISCGESLIGDGEPPSGYEDWLTELGEMTAQVEVAKTSANQSAQIAQAAATSAQASAASATESATAAGVAQGAAEAAQAAAETAQGKAETAQTAAEAAETNAQLQAYNAREYARDAEMAKQVAVNSASTATTKATQATQSATASANSASESAESATASANSANEASQSATSASESAQSASTSATTAQNASASASQSASDASVSASQASASATSASTSASDAQTSATNASTSATQASESATQASTSATNASASATQAQEYAEQAEESAEHFVLDTKLIKDSTNGVENQAIYPLLGAFPTDTASGSVASFSDGAELPLKSLTIGIDLVQDTSQGDPSPTNICPISGWTGMQLNVNGTEIPISWESEAGTVYGGTLDVTNGVLTVDRVKETFVFNNPTEDSTYNLESQRFNLTKRSTASSNSTGKITNVCGAYAYAQANWNNGRPHFYVGTASCILYLTKNTYRGGNVELCYPLETPLTYQLTPTEVNSLLGQNNIYADTGDTAVTYRADPTLYIQRKIAEAISALS